MVSPGRRRWRSGEEVPRGFRKRCSLEWCFWSMSRFLSNIRRCLVFALLTETLGARVQEDILWVADPKAINYILQKTGYLYAKPNNVQERTALLADRGVAWAEGELSIVYHMWTFPASRSSNNPTGDIHIRHRRAMSPAFGLFAAKGLLPYFMDSVAKARKLLSYLILKADPSLTTRWQTSGVVSYRAASPEIQPLSM